ncbi:unnamed protein product [Cyclocybe aegerita]|uniref:Uncharacterized protein n=1 Tax=Cyclocybe aegerita TaxID=1973307 RepID=A0A8S0XLD0_CYCAE|nr:unnamed protein product [Cyclocybe aegerita]
MFLPLHLFLIPPYRAVSAFQSSHTPIGVTASVTASVFAAKSNTLLPVEITPHIASLIAATYVAGSVAYFARDVYTPTFLQDILYRRSALGDIIDVDLLLPHPEVFVHDAKVYGPACMRVSQLAAFEIERAIHDARTVCASNDGPGKELAIVIQGEGVCSPEDAPPVVDSNFYGPACIRPSQLAAFVEEKIMCASNGGRRRSPRLAEIAARGGSADPSSSQGGDDGPDDEPGNGSGGNNASGGDSRQPTRTVASSDGSKKPPSKKKPTSKRVRNNDSPPPPPPPSPPSVEAPEPANNGNNMGWTCSLLYFILGALLTAVVKSSEAERLSASICTWVSKRSRRQERTIIMSRNTVLAGLALVALCIAVSYIDPSGRLLPSVAKSPMPPPTTWIVDPQPRVTEPPMRLVIDKNHYTMDYRSMATATATAQATSLPSPAGDSLFDMEIVAWVLLAMAMPIFLFIVFHVISFIGRVSIKLIKCLFARRAEPTKSAIMPTSSLKLVPIYISQGLVFNPEKYDPEDPLSCLSNETLFVDVRTEFSVGTDSASGSDS